MPKLRSAALAAALLALSAAPVRAQKPDFALVGRAPVTATRITGLAVFRAPDGRDYAYGGTFGGCPRCVGGRMYAWDVTDPANPTLTDSVMVDAGIVNDVAVNPQGTLAVVTRERGTSGRNGIIVLDLKDPAHPRKAADYWETLTGGAHAVTLDSTYAYVVDQGGSDLAIIDLSDLSDPREVGRWGLPGVPGRFLQHVAVKDGLAYLAYWTDGLAIVDVGNGVKGGTVRRPRLVSRFTYRVDIRNTRVPSNTAFVYPYTTGDGKKYLLMVDHIVAPNADLNRRFDVAGAVHVLDVSRLEVPRQVAEYNPLGGGTHAVAVLRDTMYVAGWSGGLRAVDLTGSLPRELRGREIARLSTADRVGYVPGLPFAWSVIPHRGHLFVSDFNSGLWVARLAPPNVGAARSSFVAPPTSGGVGQ